MNTFGVESSNNENIWRFHFQNLRKRTDKSK